MFYRAYDEEGNPVKSNNFYKWSKNGAQAGESVFVIGRPGSTERLYSISQLEYLRDYVYPIALISFNAIYDAYYRLYQIYPDDQDLLNNVMRWGNSRKSYAGRLAGLKNEYIMKKKKSFQEHLQSKIYEDPDLRERYGEVWKIIDSVIIDLSRYALKNRILRASRYIKPSYYTIAEELIKIVEQNNIPENEREAKYRKENIDSTISTLFDDNFDSELNDALLSASMDFLNSVLDSLEIEVFSMDMNILPNADELKSSSKILNKDVFSNYLKLNIDEIKKLKDPFLEYVFFIKDIEDEISDTLRILNNSLSVYNQMLGEAVYAVFGDKIPPDATSTLRISDGVIKGYEYNGTIAPGKTTYFGLWDRYESFGGETYPWGLHERWKIPPEELDLSVDVGFASTNDIVGGNSGSSAINAVSYTHLTLPTTPYV
jgi:hypothetical protein